MTTRRPTTLVAAIAVVALLLAGCGDDDGGEEEGGDRPTTEELVPVLDMDLDEQGQECVAQALVDSEVTDEGLQAIIDGGGLAGAVGVSQADQAAVEDALGEGIRCSIADELPGAGDEPPPVSEGGPGGPPSSEDGSTEPPSSDAPSSTEAPPSSDAPDGSSTTAAG